MFRQLALAGRQISHGMPCVNLRIKKFKLECKIPNIKWARAGFILVVSVKSRGCVTWSIRKKKKSS